MTTPTLNPVRFDAPLVNPNPHGLYGVTAWTDDVVPRWLASGVQVRPHNYGGESAFGVWAAEWCGDPGDELKDGERPDPDTTPFDPTMVWAFDSCDPTPGIAAGGAAPRPAEHAPAGVGCRRTGDRGAAGRRRSGRSGTGQPGERRRAPGGRTR